MRVPQAGPLLCKSRQTHPANHSLGQKLTIIAVREYHPSLAVLRLLRWSVRQQITSSLQVLAQVELEVGCCPGWMLYSMYNMLQLRAEQQWLGLLSSNRTPGHGSKQCRI